MMYWEVKHIQNSEVIHRCEELLLKTKNVCNPYMSVIYRSVGMDTDTGISKKGLKKKKKELT